MLDAPSALATLCNATAVGDFLGVLVPSTTLILVSMLAYYVYTPFRMQADAAEKQKEECCHADEEQKIRQAVNQRRSGSALRVLGATAAIAFPIAARAIMAAGETAFLGFFIVRRCSRRFEQGHQQ